MAAFLDMITLSSKSIGDVAIQATIEEVYHDELQITEHPVEIGAEIADHAYKRQPEVVIKCGWSNADYAALLGAAQAIFSSGTLPTADYVNTVYSQLLALQESRVPFDVVTSRRQYTSMLLQGLTVINDAKTSGALMVTATCRQVLIANTRATSLPPNEDQATPASTAETADTGVKSAMPATPAPGGSVPPTSM